MTQKEMFPIAKSSPQDTLASHSALHLRTAKAQKMSDISGLTSKELSPQKDLTGAFLRMFADISQTDLMPSSMTFTPKTTPQSQCYYRLTVSAQFMKEPGFISWPTPTTGAALCGGTGNFNKMAKLKELGYLTEEERRNLTQGNGGKSNPALMEWLMGYPIGWTETPD
tara:strand:+ start:99 stop:602 length:504 start_codon:yes stop_codon:yes gene_type:complete